MTIELKQNNSNTIKTSPSSNNKDNKVNSEDKQIQVLLCFFGVIARSLKKTIPNINKNIIQPIKEMGFNLEIYGFNINIGNTKIDGENINNNDIKLISFDYLSEILQEDLDKKINYEKKKYICYNGITKINAIRQMYSEYMVSNFIKKKEKYYDIVVVCGPDYSFKDKIEKKNLTRHIQNDAIISTCDHRDFGGYTNGFYIGTPKALIPVLNRLNNYESFVPETKRGYNYEKILRHSFIFNKKKRIAINFPFIKIRANGRKRDFTSKKTGEK